MSTATAYTDAAVDALIALLVRTGNIAGDGTLTLTTHDGSIITLGTVQQLNDDLDAIAHLSPVNNDVLQRKLGAWVNRTPAQLLTDLSSDLSAIAGLTLSNGDTLRRVSGGWVRRADLTVYKAAAASNRTSTTLVADPDLTVSLAASSKYHVRFSVILAGTGGLGISWTAPAGVSGGYALDAETFGVGDELLSYTWGATPSPIGTTGSSFSGEGILITSTTPGTFCLNWGAHTSSDAVQLGAGSVLRVRQID